MKKEEKKVKVEVIEKLATLITAAFGFVAALAWNDAIKSIFKTVFGEQSDIIAQIVYALVVTILAVFVTMQIGKSANKIKNISERRFRKKHK